MSTGAHACSRGARLCRLLLQVLLRDRGEQGDEHAKSREDVDDREDLGPRVSQAVVGAGIGLVELRDVEATTLEDAYLRLVR